MGQQEKPEVGNPRKNKISLKDNELSGIREYEAVESMRDVNGKDIYCAVKRG